MGNKKTKAMIELIDRIEKITRIDDQAWAVSLIEMEIALFRVGYYDPKKKEAEEKKKSKAQAKIEESRRKYTWSWQVPKAEMAEIVMLMDEEDAAKIEAKAKKAAKRRAGRGGRAL